KRVTGERHVVLGTDETAKSARRSLVHTQPIQPTLCPHDLLAVGAGELSVTSDDLTARIDEHDRIEQRFANSFRHANSRENARFAACPDNTRHWVRWKIHRLVVEGGEQVAIVRVD